MTKYVRDQYSPRTHLIRYLVPHIGGGTQAKLWCGRILVSLEPVEVDAALRPGPGEKVCGNCKRFKSWHEADEAGNR